MKKQYVLLDRDGTIIVDKNYQKDPALTELLPHAKEGLDKLRATGFGLVITTNQSGIGRGLLTESDVAAVNREIVRKLGGRDDYFAGIFYCPHIDADNCRCRKPLPGLVEMAAAKLGFSPADCYAVGDSERDLEMGRAAGAAAVLLVRTGNGGATERSERVKPDFVARDLLEAAKWIINRRITPP